MQDSRGLLSLALVLLAHGLCAHAAQADEIPHRRYDASDGLSTERIYALSQTPDGLLWVATAVGLESFDGERFRSVTWPDSVGRGRVLSIATMPDGAVWAVREGAGIAEIRSGRVARLIDLEEPVSRLLARGDTLLVLTAGALWTLRPGEARPQRQPLIHPAYPTPEAQHNDTAVFGDITVDRLGRIWVLHQRYGPAQLRADGWLDTVDVPEAQPGGFWRRLRVLADGRLLFIRPDALLSWSQIEGARILVEAPDAGMRAMLVEGDRVLVSTQTGVVRWDAQENRLLPAYDGGVGIPMVDAWGLLRGQENGLWVGTAEGLIHLFAPEARSVRSVDGTPLRYHNRMVRADDGSLWTHSYGGGLVQVTPQLRVVRPNGEGVWTFLLRGADGRFHALGSSGWFRYQEGRWQIVTEPQGTRAIHGTVWPDGRGVFWHNDGLFLHDPGQGSPRGLVQWPLAERMVHTLAPGPGREVYLRAHDVILRHRSGEPGRWDTLGTVPTDGAVSVDAQVDAAGRMWIALVNQGVLVVKTRAPPNADGVLPHRLLLPNEPVRGLYALDGQRWAVSASDGLWLLDAETGEVLHRVTKTDGLFQSQTSGAAIVGDDLWVTQPSAFTRLPLQSLMPPPRPLSVVLHTVEAGGEWLPISEETRLASGLRAITFRFGAPTFRDRDELQYEVRLLPDGDWETTRTGEVRYAELGPGSHRFEVRARQGSRASGPVTAYSFWVAPRVHETVWFRFVVALLIGVCGVVVYRARTRGLRQRQATLEATVAARTADLQAEKARTEEQARKLLALDEAKRRFLANLSHEFRTPITLLLGPLEDGLPEAPEARRRQEAAMRRSAHRLRRLVDQLLDLATLEAGHMQLHPMPGDLAAFVTDLVRTYHPHAERQGLTLTCRAPDGLWRVFDADAIEKIVGNLIGNALKFTPKGGKVWVGLTAQDDEVEVVVKDTGPGIPADVLPLVFERFRQGSDSPSRSHEGTGLGLALASELAELHGGTLRAESEPGFGSAFTLRVPLAVASSTERAASGGRERGDTEAASGDLPHVTTPEAPPEAPLVLVVDDNADIRAFVRQVIGDAYRVVEASDGGEGLAVARRQRPALVLTDVMMPEVDGMALIRSLRDDAAFQTTPIVILTARASEEDAVEGLEAGADDVLVKPFRPAELRARLARLLDARRALREQYSAEVVIQSSGVAVPSEEAAWLDRVREAAEPHLGDSDFSVDALAEAVGVSTRTLRRRLRTAADLTPQQYLRRLRLTRAADLLRQRAATPAEVAYAVGFRNPSHFSRAFREQFGHAPSEHARTTA